MPENRDAAYRYKMTIKMFGAEAEPAFEMPEQQEEIWGRKSGCDNDVGQLRVVLMHRTGVEMDVVDPRTAVIGRTIRVNDEGVRQIEEVLRAQGVELIRIDMCGYDIHIDAPS